MNIEKNDEKIIKEAISEFQKNKSFSIPIHHEGNVSYLTYNPQNGLVLDFDKEYFNEAKIKNKKKEDEDEEEALKEKQENKEEAKEDNEETLKTKQENSEEVKKREENSKKQEKRTSIFKKIFSSERTKKLLIFAVSLPVSYFLGFPYGLLTMYSLKKIKNKKIDSFLEKNNISKEVAKDIDIKDEKMNELVKDINSLENKNSKIESDKNTKNAFDEKNIKAEKEKISKENKEYKINKNINKMK
ncbi:hypothetical protein [Mycoplasma tauri]|uniref:hypothetical protein n=1 Tax=Mycoplasma tauri TaxID=547987 RepID=UPI0019678606|nr:hypothetical protein [Mycoplasma tauri]MBZ4226991.1 hypothetical protein [Mycoplasma tauri]QSB07629.1 hypothetical protein JS510_00670 [Mycoplasma tauri]